MSAWMDNIGTSSFRRVRTVITNQSPFNGTVYRSALDDARWQFRFDYQMMTRSEAAPLLAAIAAQEEGAGSFEVYDPDFGVPMSGYLGSGAVQGAGQNSKNIITDGWAASTLIAKAGDRVFVFLGSTFRMFTATTNITSNGSGEATFTLDTQIAPPDNATVGVAAIAGGFRITARLISYDVQSEPGGLFRVTVNGEELL